MDICNKNTLTFWLYILSGKKSAGKKDESVDLVVGHIIALFHAFFLAQCAGASATVTSTYLLLGIDFAINLYFTFKIIQLYKKEKIPECGEMLQVMVLNETLEFMAPLTYLMCFLAAYFGPNYSFIGRNV